MSDIIVIAGTVDAREIIYELAKLEINITATVATRFGNELIGELNNVHISEGKLTADEMADLIIKSDAKCIVDASHPYAREASLNAMKACEDLGVIYIRYERDETCVENNNFIYVSDFDEAAEKADMLEGNILLTTGSNNLDVFIKKISNFKKRIFVRVLPDSRVIEKCEEAGLTAYNIIAIKGPFTIDMNIEMLKHCNAKVMITKDSGIEGGTLEKIKAEIGRAHV
jgi:precorrin-6A/cobalt-precorrin-6A reductase